MNRVEAAQLAIDPQGLGDVRRLASRDDPEALRKAAQSFEALLVNQLMKSMREADFGDDLFESSATKTFTGMLDQQYAETLSRGSGLGLAELIVRQVEMARDATLQKTPSPSVNP